MPDQPVGVLGVDAADGDADAGADLGDVALAEVDRDVELGADPVDDAADGLGVERAAEQDGELVAAEAGSGVGRAQAAAQRVAIVRSTASPTSWPYSSLTGLKPSRSRYSTAGQACVRATSTAWRARSRNSVRLGSPVSASCRVWWRSCSLRSVTWRSVSSSRPRSARWPRAAEGLEQREVAAAERGHVTEPAGDEQQPVHPVLGAQCGAIASL